jgi:tetratricopeptide (TPR) repeat protein
MKCLRFFVAFALLFSVFAFFKGAEASSPVLPDPASDKKTISTPSSEAYYRVIFGLLYESQGQFEKALNEYQRALVRDEKSPFLMTRMAVSLARVGDLKKAVLFAEKANAVKPSDSEVLNLLADLYAAGDAFEKVVATYNKIIRQSPKEIDGYLNLAQFLAKEQRLPEAIGVVEKGLIEDPYSHLGHYYLAKLYTGEKEYIKGIAHYEEAIILYPTFLQAHLLSATLYELLGKRDEAERAYRRILSEDKMEHEEAGLRLAAILTEKKAFSEAMEVLNKLSIEHSKNADIFLKISLLWAEQKEYQKALDVFKRVMQIEAPSSNMKSYLASLYEAVGEHQAAIAVYREMLQKDGNSYDIYLRLGGIYLHRLKRMPEALAEGEKALALNAKRHEAYLLTGLALHETERFEEAVVRFSKGIAAAPNEADLHFHLGVTYDKLGRFDALVAEMERAIVIDSGHVMALNYLGYTYADRGMLLEEAVSLIARALSIRPDDGYVMDSLGWAYYKQGKFKESLDALEKAVVLAPNDPVILEHLGEVYLKENERERGRDAWVHSLKLDPKNEKLKARFREAGFAIPIEETAPVSPDSHKKDVEKSSLHSPLFSL